MKHNTVTDSGAGLDLRASVAERVAWTESIVITLLSIVLPAWSHPHNPFYVNEGFPWPALGPVLCALRYGFAHGFTSALMVVAALGTAINRGWWPAVEFPFTYAVGVIVTAMLCGEFRDIWQRRLEKLQAANDYRGERLEEFTRSHHLLRVSHDQLEQQLAGSGLSLREVLMQLHHRFEHAQGFGVDNAKQALAVLSELASLQIAAIYPVVDGKAVLTSCLAQSGQFSAIGEQDPMIRRCLRDQHTVAVTADANGLELAAQSRLLACVPFVDAKQQCHAILLVQAMPLFALTEARLRVLTIAAAHLCDMLTRASDLTQQPSFESVLQRMQRDLQQFGVASSLLLARAAIGSEGETTLLNWKSRKRALDVWQQQQSNGVLSVAILMPLTDDAGVRQLLSRFDKQNGISTQISAVDAKSSAVLQSWFAQESRE